MALFKIHKGTGTFPTKATEGYCYFNSETGRFAIDIADATTASNTERKLINPDAFVGVSRSDTTWTFTKADGTTFDITQQDSNTDTKVKSTVTQPSSNTRWYLLATTSSSTSTGEAVKNTNLNVEVIEGTTSATGKIELVLGNSTASGTAGNKHGYLSLFSDGTSYHLLKGASTDSSISHTLPATTGTILNTGTTSWTAMDASTAKIGTLKINGTNNTLYDVALYAIGTLLTENTDLNTIKAPGIYYSSSSTLTKTLTNKPWESSGFRLMTFAGYGAISSYGLQVAAASSMLFWRNMGASNNSPSDWYVVPQIPYTGNAVGSSTLPVYMNADGKVIACSTNLAVNITGTAGAVAWSNVSDKPSYYDAKAIKGITRSGTTFTYTCMDGTTGTFSQQDSNTTYGLVSASANGLAPMFDAADGTINSQANDWVLTNKSGTLGWYKLPSNAFNNSTYSFSNKAATLSWGTAVTIATVGGTDITVKLPANPNTDTNTAHAHTAGNGLIISGSGGTSGTTTYSLSNSFTVTGTITAGSVVGAVWNDYAEYRITKEKIEAGRVVIENGDDTLSLATERLMPGANIVSDTFGFSIGETDEAQTPLAVSGRVLAYPYEDRNSYKPGDPVCSGPNGTVSKMTREEVMMYPDRIIGTVSAIPTYETWGSGNVQVNERIWIRIR